MKNVSKFGWVCEDAYDLTTTTTEISYEGEVRDGKLYVRENRKSSSRTRSHLYFERPKGYAPKSMQIVEIAYNCIFYLRKLIGFLIPIVFLACWGVFFFANTTDWGMNTFQGLWFGGLAAVIVWALLRLFENLFANWGEKLLRKK
ncbi:MAG: hypothetical protein IJX18_00620 [Clostridia bacterium]|nr:hypothetical protein [Clostridia bacterium]